MTYRVVFAPSFQADMAAQVDFLRARLVPDRIIEGWFDGLYVRIHQLSDWPSSYPVDQKLSRELGFEVRKLVYHSFIITYQVDESLQIVNLLAMVHGARRN